MGQVKGAAVVRGRLVSGRVVRIVAETHHVKRITRVEGENEAARYYVHEEVERGYEVGIRQDEDGCWRLAWFPAADMAEMWLEAA